MKDPHDDLFEWSITEALFATPARLFVTAWAGHMPFLFALIKLMQPRTYVELGVHFGGSFVCACTAARRYSPATQCIGVDSWQGDIHAGAYDGNAAYAKLQDYLSTAFPQAKLIRETFDAARDKFTDGSIDILHIDGFHSYDVVKRDFEHWHQKLSNRGIVLFHDTAVREREFGVWKFWEQIKGRYRTMEFFHASGLGVVFIGEDQPVVVKRLLAQWDENRAFREFFRTACEHAGESLRARMYPTAAETLASLTQQSRMWKLLWPITKHSGIFRKADEIGRLVIR